MFATFPRTRGQRRGVVLILVLGMLGLLALIGVTFATFSGQVKVNSRNFSQAQNWPDSSELMDYALAQLIDDTDSPQSAIRGHSLKRDMYGSDGFYNSALVAHPTSGAAMMLTVDPVLVTASDAVTSVRDPYVAGATIGLVGLYRCTTNIPINDPAFYGYNFTRWIVRFPQSLDTTVADDSLTPPRPALYNVAQTHEILAHDPADSSGGGTHVFYIATWDSQHPTPPFASIPTTLTQPYLEAPHATNLTPDLYSNLYSLSPTIPYPLPHAVTLGAGELPPTPYYGSPESVAGHSRLRGAPKNIAFTLDGRFLHAFNGPGMSGNDGNLAGLPAKYDFLKNRGMAQYANFRVNGNLLIPSYNATDAALTSWRYGDPNATQLVGGMDEDYDACDLENWFLALQSADGQIMVPSFHRPGILINDASLNDPITGTAPWDDWSSQNVFSAAKILRPRAVDGHSPVAFKNLYPDKNGKITYDVDNDGDGVTDSVWLDLGYPARRNSAGQLYKPLYAFMIIGLNGRIPLNTAGNLQLRDLAGVPLAMHASGKGNSPSEIDPSYALQNAFDFTLGGYNQFDDADVPVSLTQLRNLLAGTRLPDKNISNGDNNSVVVNGANVFMPNGVGDPIDSVNAATGLVPTATTAVEGRWGEGDQMPDSLPKTLTPTTLTAGTVFTYPNAVRAGLSGRIDSSVNPPVSYGDARDDNRNSFDSYPLNPTLAGPPFIMPGGTVPITTLGEQNDYLDSSGSLSFPVERIRRFVTPIDVSGDGMVNSLAAPLPAGSATLMPQLLGPDSFGRVSYLKHFRAPGLGLASYPGLSMMATPSADSAAARIYYPTAQTTSGTPLFPDLTTNLYHGYEANRVPMVPDTAFAGIVAPVGPLGLPAQSVLVGGMLTSEPNDSPPTLDQFTSTSNLAFRQSANLNEADEMQLYSPTPFDSPYGPGDLEWLYRPSDTDGASLASRLNDLAPVSFKNPKDGNHRRRMFSLDSWEPTNFVWANDLPQNDPQFFLTATLAVRNSSFTALQDASLSKLSSNNSTLYGLPSVAHRNRKINLNFPLPVSNRYDEPVRQKWIRETYQLLKLILPPKATDTPEELAQLSQFVINIVDFRDTDSTSTRFVNTDVYYATKALVTSPATLEMTDPTALPPLAGDLVATGMTRPPAFSPLYDSKNSPHLVQYGMEYSPVAINEVLAYIAAYGTTGASLDQARMWLELVNTLTPPAKHVTGALDPSRASHLDLQGWDVVIMPDDPTGRPDPYTGQLPYQDFTTTPVKPVSVNQTTNESTTDRIPATTVPPQPAPATTKNPGGLLKKDGTRATINPIPVRMAADMDDPAPDYFVIGNDHPGGTAAETGAPGIDAEIDLVTNTILSSEVASATNKYFWVYLRRPANPFDTSYDSTRPNENRVVVDSFRFSLETAPWIGNGSGGLAPRATGGSATVVPGTIYSTQRLQPYRGGHAVPLIQPLGAPPLPANYCIPAYGFSEQTYPAIDANGSTLTDQYGGASSSGIIWHTLGKANEPSDEGWEHFAFHDRDFTSVAELLLVPGCPPGLFTKSFVEFVPGSVPATPANVTPPLGTQKAATTWPPAAGPIPWPPPTAAMKFTKTDAPRTFPYLVDEFFYTAQSAEPETYMKDATIATPAGISWPDPGTGPAPIHPNADYPVAFAGTTYSPFPFNKATANGDYFKGAPYPKYIGGPSGAGWYKMFEFFEVPSPALGSIGSVAQGSNYDWARQDLKPGLLNINLIIDEEVFFALMSESWLKTLSFPLNPISSVGPPVLFAPSQVQVDQMGDTRLNVEQIADASMTPKIVSEVLASGAPTTFGIQQMDNKGFWALDPFASNLTGSTGPVTNNKMKASFSDFLKLRHGGSGFMFGYQSGNVGDPNTKLVPAILRLASERPFRSFSYPDINHTLLRPAALPPTTSTILQPYLPSFATWLGNLPSGAPGMPGLPSSVTNSPFKTYVGDPGLKNPYFFTQNNPPLPPPIPARRLFEVPDVYGYLSTDYTVPAAPTPSYPDGFPITTPGSPAPVLPSNASSAESTYPQTFWGAAVTAYVTFTGDPNTNWQNLGPVRYDATGNPVAILSKRNVTLAASPTLIPRTSPIPTPPYVFVPNFYLGANSVVGSGSTDNRQHPAFRYDWLHKVTNLTTVRTHQYAVWITVGFFEVTKPGDPSLITTNLPLVFASNPPVSYDRLGQELNVQDGRNIRYRSFFIIDRTKAVGFSPQAPGNFRDCITYRQTIE